MAITVGSIATTATSAIIIAEDFLINVFTCLKIVYLLRYKNKINSTMKRAIGLLQELTISEMVECRVTPCYLLCFIAAYYGPNAELIGDIKNGYWQYTAVQDVENTIKVISIFWLVDMSSLLICSMLLWVFCKVNLYRSYAALLTEFGWGFWIAMTISVNGVRG